MIYFEEPKFRNETTFIIQEQIVEKKQSPCFASKINRFQNVSIQTLTPGPGAYEIPSKDIQRTSKYKIKTPFDNCLRLEHLWLLQDKRFGSSKIIQTKNIGPGTYLPQNSCSNTSRLYSFSKNQRFNKQKSATTSKLGPGVYEIQNSHMKDSSRVIVSSFKSKSSRFKNLFDNNPEDEQSFAKMKFVSPTTQLESKIKRDNQMLRNMQLLKQLKQVENTKNQNNLISYVFKSRKPRFQLGKFQKVGPGYYEIDGKQTQKSQQMRKMRKIKKTQSELKQSHSFVNEDNVLQIPAPNQYKVNQHTIDTQIKKLKKGGYINQQTRFNFHKKSNSESLIIPGPGQYSQNKYTFVDKDTYIKKNFDFKNKNKQVFQTLIPFLSSSQRISAKQKQQKLPFGYDYNIYDIGRKIEKNKTHLTKLKLMDIELSVFNTKQRRKINQTIPETKSNQLY